MNIGDTVYWEIGKEKGYSGTGVVLAFDRARTIEERYNPKTGEMDNLPPRIDCSYEEADHILIEVENGVRWLEKKNVK